MVDEYELEQPDDSQDPEDISIEEAYYDEATNDLGYRWRDPLRPTGIGDSEDTWY